MRYNTHVYDLVTLCSSPMRVTANNCPNRKICSGATIVDDKVFALSLYKQSGKAYRMLSKVFALPSCKCITDMLKKIPFQTGINQRIFKNLKNAVQKLKIS
ncbi:unnamed protein product [Macrosiphum euphorbiae]|uniref:Uncharacterized protein n=1 Tax=Macrosiphum euphorbiae TaxID=13131 RepID=A0AAV0WWN1_9HEMI|nr:unnamed protein product [Macrosiphum euphorbiae]